MLMWRPASLRGVRAVAALATLSLLALGLLAGCFGDGEDPSAPAADPETGLPANVQVFRAGLNLAASPEPLGLAEHVLLNHSGAEPNIGITSDGSIFVTSGSVVMRSQDEGRTWASVQEHMFLNSDPMLWVDTDTDRVYHAPMFPILLCSTLYWSDDFGATWATNPSAVCGRGAYDHQKVATARPGPDAPATAGTLWPTVVYSCYNGVAVTNCAVSYDGGLTWPIDRPTQVNVVPTESPGLATGCGSGQNGHPTGAPDGTVVFARNAPGCPRPFLTVSRDSGLTWSVVLGPDTANPQALDPEVAFTPDGTLYMLYQDEQFNELLARSADMGQTWDGPWVVSPPGVTSTSFQALGTGSDGRIAMGFLGTRDGEGSPSDVNDTARWHLYFVTSGDANATEPTFTSYQATPDADPVQIGCVFQGGGSNPCRNLLDFIDGAVAPDGTFFVAYTEGCVSDDCLKPDATGEDSRARTTSVGVLRGWSLYRPGETRPPLLV
jgi:hypothetical protein